MSKINAFVVKDIIKEVLNIDTNNISLKRLNGGFKNKVYLVNVNTSKYVLKVSLESNMLSDVDKDKLGWEYDVLKALDDVNIPTPTAYYYSKGVNTYPHPFILMEYMPGNNFKDCRDNLPIQTINSIYYLLGKYMYEISKIKKDYYYIPGFKKERYNTNYDMLKDMFSSIMHLYEKHNINVEGITSKQIMNILSIYKDDINNVKNVCLCNTDIWDGNVLIKNMEISGIIDFGDTYYADELMAYYFHDKYEGINEYFRLGYNNIKLDSSDLIRIKIYQMYSLLKTIIDCEIKKYGRFGKCYLEFVKIFNELCYNVSDGYDK